MDANKKCEILLKSFETLKGRINDNSDDTREIGEIVEKVMIIDANIALEMWIYILKTYTAIGEDSNKTYFLVKSIFEDFVRLNGCEKFLRFVKQNELVRTKAFKECGQISGDFFIHLIHDDLLYDANEFFNDVYSNNNFCNRKHGNNFSDLLIYISTMLERASEDAINLLTNWADKVADEEDKAKITVKLIDFM